MTGNQQRARINSNRRDKSLEWALSPYGAAAFSSVIFLAAWLLPPSIYSAGLDEPDYLWLDPLSLLLFASCAVAFILGARLCDRNTSFQSRSPVPAHVLPIPYIIPPLIITIAFELIAIFIVIQQQPGILSAVLSGAGGQVKGDLVDVALPAGISAAGAATLAVMYWAYHAYQSLANGRGKKMVGRILAFYVGLSFAISLMTLGRDQIMMIVVGLAVIRTAYRIRSHRDNIGGGQFIAKVAFGLIAIFLITALIRQTTLDEMLGTFYGYTISGYNRMAAILHHQLPYLDAGNGDHLFGGILQNRTINSLVPFQTMYDLPDQLDVWLSDFAAVGGAGLIPQYTFASCFGFIFIDAGWGTIAVMFLCGMFSGYIWLRFKQGKTIGVVVYPVVLFSALMWFGTNMLINMNTIMFVLTSAALALYELPFRHLTLAPRGIRVMHPLGIIDQPNPPESL